MDCLKECGEGVRIDVHVIPGSKGGGMKYDDWERRLRVKVRAPVRGGKANDEVVGLFSSIFGNCKIVSGTKSRKKCLLVRNCNRDEINYYLERIIEAGGFY